MAKFIISCFFLFPTLLTAQLMGEYMFHEGVFSMVLSFDKEGNFEFQGGRSVGKGNYILSGDMMQLNFGKYPSMNEDKSCSHQVYSLETATNLDSFSLSISITDNETKEPIPFSYILIGHPSKEEFTDTLMFDQSGQLTFKLPNRADSIIVFANAAEYKAHFCIIPAQSAKVVFTLLLEDWRSYVEEGTVWKYQILEQKKRFIKLAFLDQKYPETPRTFLKLKESWSEKRRLKEIQKCFGIN